MKNAILRGTSRFRAHFRSAWRSFVAFAAFALTGGTLFAAPGPYEADTTGEPEQYEGYVLSWSDEFNGSGYPDPANWGYELGYVRNGEAQKYTKSLDNAVVGNGALHIYGRKEADGTYTSASLISKGLRHFKYGRYEFRAKVPISGGAWPVLWMMGAKYSWPACGEIDIMEYYSGKMHANWCWGADHGSYSPWGDGSSNALWDFSIDYLIKGGEYRGSTFPANADFFNQFHVWRMDWTSEKCTIYIDGIKVNEQTLDDTLNLEGYEPESVGKSPFREPQYILMDIAMGTNNGGAIDDSALPMEMEVDYVRCYKRTGTDEGLVNPAPIDMTPGEGEAYVPVTTEPTAPAGYHLAWNDEFDTGDTPSASNWSMEDGSTEYVANGVLVMPMTNATGALTWGGLDSAAGRTFTKGVMEIRARLPMARGSTVFLTTSTAEGADPYGYVELLDFGWSAASPFIGGWVECPGVGDWFDIGFETLRETNDKWAAQFHVWRYIVDDEAATVTLDGRQLYRKPISQLSSIGKDTLPHNLAFWVGTDDVSLSDPLIGHGLEIDYVRVYEPGEEEDPQVDPPAAANRIVMVGDSITVQSWQDGNRSPCSWGFSRLIDAKLPAEVTVVPLGWSGQVLSGWKDTEAGSRGGTGNYGTELETGFFVGTELDKAADAIFVMLGMNDLLKPTTYDTTDSIAVWKANLKTFAQNLKAREAGKNATIYIASVTLLTEDLTGPKNAMLDKLAIAAQEVVSELGEGYAYVPVRENYKTFFNTCRQANPEFHGCFDFVHPTEGGHAVIAKSYLTALGKTTEAAAIQTSNIDPIIAHVIATAPTSYVAPTPAPWLVGTTTFSLQGAWEYPVLNDTKASGAIEAAIEAGKTPTELLTVDASRLTGWTTYTSSVDYPGGATDASICYNKLFNAAPFSAVYAARYVYSPTARKVTLSVTKESFSECPYVAIWVNGEKVHVGQTLDNKEIDLKEGDNLVYVRSSQIEWFWQQSVAFGPSASCPDVSDLVYGTVPYVPVDPVDPEDVVYYDNDNVAVSGAPVVKTLEGENGSIVFSFSTNGTFALEKGAKVDILLVGGGGGGAAGAGGGGGAGRVLYSQNVTLAAGTYSISVGEGGNGGISSGVVETTFSGVNGGGSSFTGGDVSYIAYGGGGGSAWHLTAGGSGGSGGGACGRGNESGVLTDNAGLASGSGLGNDGGNGIGANDWTWASGGGGGASAAGGTATTSAPGNGGAGYSCAITGETRVYGGGGGGGSNFGTASSGGQGGGGAGKSYEWNGGANVAVAGENGADGLGGGGGAGGAIGTIMADGGNGGDGVVIVRYYLASGEEEDDDDSDVTATGATATKVGDDDLFTFAADGMIKFTEAKTVEVLLVGGGAGGGCHGGGGGGAGGVIHLETLQIAAGEYPVTVGLGGLGSQDQNLPGGNGGVSSVFGYTAFGGGGGGSIYVRSGVNGASGGGASETIGWQAVNSNWQYGLPGAGVEGQGFSGGMSYSGDAEDWSQRSAGGGGAGETGGSTDVYAGKGGDGVACAITGSSVVYGGGGGGGFTTGGGVIDGGNGGGGNGYGYEWTPELDALGDAGRAQMPAAGGNGTDGLGGGGGGGGGYYHHFPGVGGNGGSGIVIVRVLASPASAGSEPSPNRPLPPSGSISASGSKGGYDGGGNHYITVNAGQEFTVEYRLPDETEWSATNPRFVNVCDTSVWYRVTSAAYETVIGSAYVIITQADNRWTTAPAVGNCSDGETPSMTFPWPLFGDGYTVSYSGTKDDGTSVSGEFTVTTQGDHTDDFPVRDPGNYKVSFTVAETDNWKGLSADFMLSIWNDATIKTADGFAFTKYLMGILDPNNNWKLVPFEDVTSLETALAKDKTGTWSATETFSVVAGYIGETTGDFDYEHNGGTDGGFPGGRWQQEDHTLIVATATLVVITPGKYTLALGMPAGCDFAMTITHDAETFTMDMSDYDETTLRAVKTFDFAEAGEYALDLAQFRAEGADYLELSYAPGEVAPEDFSTSTFSLIGKTAMVPEEEPVVPEIDGYTLVWNDEFNTDGAPNAEKWDVANPENAVCKGGALVMTAEDGTMETDYRYAGLQAVDGEFSFGHYEIRAKMPFGNGIHGAFQFDGSEAKGGYPTAGCLDLIDTEFAWNDDGGYSDTVALWTTWEEGREIWSAKNITDFAGDDETWADKYHVWTIDWDEEQIVLSLDGEVYKTITTAEMTSSSGYSPAADPENLFGLVLALDKRVGNGDVPLCAFPQTMEVDYIRYYKPTSEGGDAFPKVDDVETTTADAFVAAVKSGSTVTLPEGGDFAWNGNVLEKGGETWATLPDYYTVGEGGVISFAVDAVKPVISAIAVDATVTVTVSNAKKGLTYGLLSATTLEGLATAEPTWLATPAADNGPLDIPAGDKGTAGFFKAVVTDQVPTL